MVKLIAKSAASGLLPLEVGAVALTECEQAPLTSLSRAAGLKDALKAAHDIALPGPNRSTKKGDARCIWFGHSHVLLIGVAPDPKLAQVCAVTDQSDAWVRVRLDGTGAVAVLGRLTPLDLRDSQFKRGHTARTDLQHMSASITRLGAQSYEVMVMRSMATTLVHDLKGAMGAIAALGS